jgi:hypothetical protein
MPSYRQISTYYEDGFGTVTTMFVVADTYAELFDLSEAADVDVFAVSSSKKDLDIAEGIMAEDELEFTMDEMLAATSADASVIAFVLEAQGAAPADRRFCAWFVNPADTDAPTVNESEFVGLLRSNMSATDALWQDAEFGTVPTPIRSWRVRARNFSEGFLDLIRLKDLIYGLGVSTDPDYVPGIDATWETANVAPRLGYYSNAGLTAKWESIASLNAVLRALADNLLAALDHQGYGTYTIDFVESPFGFGFLPARFGHHGYATPHRNAALPYQIQPGTPRVVKLGDGIGDEEQLYINYLTVKPAFATSPPGGDPFTYGWERLETFPDLLYAIAKSFGLFVRFDYTSTSNLEISFLSRAGIKKHQIWLRDVSEAQIETKETAKSAANLVRSESFYLATAGTERSQGVNHYCFDTKQHLYTISDLTKDRQANEKGDRLLFSIAPTMRDFGYIGEPWASSALPHNARMYRGATAATNELEHAGGITTAIYIKMPGYNEAGLGSGDRIILPVAMLVTEIDGQDCRYYTLHDYVNEITGRDSGFYDAEYSLTVPYLCSHRMSADGTHASDDGGRGRIWNLILGCELVFDGRSYVVVGIERAGAQPETRLRLHYTSRFSFSASTGITSPISPQNFETPPPAGVVLSKETYEDLVAGDAMRAGDLVREGTDGKVYRAAARASTCYDRLVGIAENDAVADDAVRVRLAGIIDIPAYALTAGEPVYLRTTTIGTPNMSATPLLVNNGTEDLYASVGVALTATSVRINFSDHIIYWPPLA